MTDVEWAIVILVVVAVLIPLGIGCLLIVACIASDRHWKREVRAWRKLKEGPNDSDIGPRLEYSSGFERPTSIDESLG